MCIKTRQLHRENFASSRAAKSAFVVGGEAVYINLTDYVNFFFFLQKLFSKAEFIVLKDCLNTL